MSEIETDWHRTMTVQKLIEATNAMDEAVDLGHPLLSDEEIAEIQEMADRTADLAGQLREEDNGDE